MSGARVEHYACVVDMLGRAGDLAGSRRVIDGMPYGVGARASAWSSLLSACRGRADSDLAREAAARVIESEPRNSAGYVLCSHVYGLNGFHSESALARSALRENGLRVVGGFSSIYVGHEAHKFVSGNGAHSECKEMYGVVERLHALMKRNDGFVHGK
ncbi:Pentatricopeptide repeat-containing protein [Acorus gramineus]|uniref:Pentatricopeptide repeat-containing protein n=1 Tax=Acorus gramineus TaxID=55184 RepID=A0AAV9ACG2_ACOGR|nr:Pentatricopeptide repeat-containing protein [Acorus gramineus]